MNIIQILCIDFAIFTLGFFGVMFFKKISSFFTAIQFIIIASAINFISFAQFIYETPINGIIFTILSITVIFIFQFILIFYIYSNLTEHKKGVFEMQNAIFDFSLNEWLKED